MQRCVEIALSYSHTRPDNTAYQSVFEGWQETDNYYSGQGHRRNMLSSNY